jgi:putative phosphoribosyl transferase
MFLNRVDAGRQLAPLVRARHLNDPVLVGMTRGGVPVAAEIARTLEAPFDICVVRKLMTPYGSTIGAVAEGGGIFLNEAAIAKLKVASGDLDRLLGRELEAVARQAVLLRDAPPLRLTGRNVVLVDDGLGSPNTVGAALNALRRQAPRSIELAIPVADARALAQLRADTDAVICASVEDVLAAVGPRYTDFSPVSDAEIVDLFAAARRGKSTASPSTTAA